ncbi:MAG TPA: glycerophosphodiester phosphodiesterase [Gaiellaceae bacterium]|nr:glycerophosphodiester phosphodiesterase [Gaiellaceae bacterium]
MSLLAIAHRGDPLAHRENTLPAFAAAVAGGADMIELDVRRTADGRVVVVHDRTLERLWEEPRRVADLMRDEVRALGIPDLAQALAAIPSNVQVMVDYEDEDVAEPALAEVAAAGSLGRVLFSGECFAGHRRIRRLAPDARIAVTWDRDMPCPDDLLDELAAEFYNPSGNVLGRDPNAVEHMHARGTQVSVWTIDEPSDMELFIEMGVDGIITNRVSSLVALLGAPC